MALVAAVLLVGFGGDDDGSPGDVGAAGTGPAAEPSAPPTEVTPDQFCLSFAAFADANSFFLAEPGPETGRTLLDAARTLLEMPTPLDMPPGARTSHDQLVAGTLEQLEDVDVPVDTAPDPANDAEPDQEAFDAYLQATCPA